MRTPGVVRLLTIFVVAAGSAVAASAQGPSPAAPDATAPSAAVVLDQRNTSTGASSASSDDGQAGQAATRQAAIEQQQAEKAADLHPYKPNTAEKVFERFDALIERGAPKWHPFFTSAYSGGGFTLGVGRVIFVSPYNFIDARGSWTFAGYKRAEVEFVAPRMFHRRGRLSVLGGWREATEVGFYGIGTDTSVDDKTNYLFQQPYLSGLLTVFPARKVFMLEGGVEFSRWSQEPGEGRTPSVETVYTPDTLPGLGAEVTYLHTQGTVGLDWRTSPGYSRRGSFLAATLHDFSDRDDNFGFQMAEYDAVQHIPILREAWVLSFHGRVQTAFDKSGQDTPFFMLPALGGGSSLRGYPSWRFRDKNSLLLQAEWRIMVNRYLDTAFFYDAGKVTQRTSDLDFDGLKSDFGFGVRFHGPFSTPLRVELAKGHDGLSFIFSSSAPF